MKKRIGWQVAAAFALGILIWGRVTTNVMAAGGVTIDETNFPDANFRSYLMELDEDSDGTFTEAELQGITKIVIENKDISDLTGIQYFTALTSLHCYGNQLTELDVSENTVLTYLDCYSNPLESLDVSKNAALTTLYCGGGKLQNLDVSGNTALKTLACLDCKVTSLDVSKNTALTTLECENNQLTSLDVNKNTALTTLECGHNQLTSLDVSKNTALTILDCSSNQLSSLDVSKNTGLQVLNCYGNQLTELDVSANTGLRKLECGSNQLTSLDVRPHTELWYLECWHNQLTSLDVSENTALVRLYCDDNQLSSLNVNNNTALTYLYCGGNQLKSLDVSANIALEQLHCEDNQLTDLNVSDHSDLIILECYSNQLTSLDVSKSTALISLSCSNNQLTNLGVSNNTALTYLACESNQLTSLNVSNNTALTSLLCGSNQLTSLDVSNNTALTYLSCGYNQLACLDVSQNTSLDSLDCSGNVHTISVTDDGTVDLSQLTGFDVNQADDWNGGSVTDGSLTPDPGVYNITYTYNCGNDKTETFTLRVAHEHVYVGWEYDEDGHWQECTLCGEETDPVVHVPGPEATTEDPQVCEICGYEIAPIHTHTGELHAGYAATCGTAGEEDYYTCTCGKAFEDEDCETEIEDLETWKVIAATGEHTYQWKSDSNGHWQECTNCGATTSKGSHTAGAAATTTSAQLCTVCGYEIAPKLHAHVGTLHTGKAATCGAAGEKDYYTCTCGKAFEDAACTKEITDLASWKLIAATGKHTTETTTTKATLTKDGSVKTVCTVCGKVTEEKTISHPKTFKLAKIAYTYDGKAKKPSVTVTDAAGKKISSENYKVTYASGRKNVGKYTVKITLEGNYTGTKTLTFKINPKGTSISKVTAGKKKLTVKWKKQAKQTTGYEIQVSLKKNFKSAKTVTVSKAKTTSKAITKLKAKKKYYVRIRTYKTVSGKKYTSSWSKVKTATTKK